MPSSSSHLFRKERIQLLLLDMKTYPHNNDDDRLLEAPTDNKALPNENLHGDASVGEDEGYNVPGTNQEEPQFSEVDESVAPDISDNNDTVSNTGELEPSNKNVNIDGENTGTNEVNANTSATPENQTASSI